MTEDCLLSERGSYYKINVFIHDGETDRNKELGGKDWGLEHLTVRMWRATYINAEEQVSRGVGSVGLCFCDKTPFVFREGSFEESHKAWMTSQKSNGSAQDNNHLNCMFCSSVHKTALTMMACSFILEWWIIFLSAAMWGFLFQQY